MEVSTLLVGTIAVSVAVMAVMQVGIAFYGARLAQRVNRLVDQIEKEIQPALSRVNDASGDVTRMTSLAVAQLERADQLFARFAERCEHVMAVSQDAVVEPLRRSVALLHGLRAALTALRDAARASRRKPGEPVGEDEDALFIG